MATRPPRIGVTRWEEVPGEPIEQYWDRVREAGGEPIDLAHPGAPGDVDALILTGGVDIDPAHYGEAPHPKVRRTDPERDAFELGLLRAALDRDVPVLAICRGMQLLNVASGGSLLQHIEGRRHPADYRAEGYPSRWHSVRIVEGTLLHDILRETRFETNSRHHQGVTPDRLAPGLRLAATAEEAGPDTIVEGLMSPAHRWVVGVQWHPERLEPDHPDFAPRMERLFSALAGAAARAPAPR